MGGIRILLNFKRKNSYERRSYFKWFLSLSLILIIPGICLAHFNYEYATSIDKGINSLFYNLKVSLMDLKNMLYNYLATPYIDENLIDIPIYKLYVKLNKIDELDSRLPPLDYFGITHAPTEFEKGYLRYDDKIWRINVRYRGDNYFHWRLPKKSWRVKPIDKGLIQGAHKLNFINPKFDSHMNTQLSYYIGEKLELTVPRSYHVALFLNNLYYGVYYYTDQIDETFLRLKNKLPGDVFVGEIGDSFNFLFNNSALWELDATKDGDEERALKELDFYLESISNDNLIDFYNFYNRYIGEEHIKFDALTALTASYQPDQFHNQKIYLNPSNAMFEPIVWDLMPFLDEYLNLSLNYFNNPLILKMHLIPEFVNKRNKIIYDSINGELSEENLVKIIEEWKEKIEYEMSCDIYKDSKDKPFTLTTEGWKQAVEKLKENIKKRYGFLKNSLDQVDVTAYVIQNKIIFDVNGESAVKLYADDLINIGNEEILYPGRKIKEKPIDWTEIFKNELEYSKLRYEYELRNKFDSSKLKLVNSITGKEITPKIIYLNDLSQLPESEDSDSLHPWKNVQNIGEEIVLENNVILEKNLIINKEDTLTIKPGTIIKLGKGISIISYGQIMAEGTKENPIILTNKDSSPWGAIVIQGLNKNLAKPNYFKYVHVSGGSGLEYDHVKYTGQVSVHNSIAYFENCKFSDNLIEDDNFHAISSYVELINCEFDNSLSDGIDFDICEGKLIDSKIINSPSNDCIDLMTSNILIKGNYINNCKDKGISIGERSYPIVIANSISNANIGIATKDESEPIIANNLIKLNDVAIAAYHKSWRYEYGGKGKAYKNILENNQKDYSIDEYSSEIDTETNEVILGEIYDLFADVDENSLENQTSERIKLNGSSLTIINEVYKE